MAVYSITVNGKTYDVVVEKKSGGTAVAASPAPAPVSAPQPAVSVPMPTAPPPAVAAAGGNKLVAPMPGKVASVKVTVGQEVKKGQELIIVEAMKMDNPLLAVNDGVVREIYVKAGDSIQTGQSLLTLG